MTRMMNMMTDSVCLLDSHGYVLDGNAEFRKTFYLKKQYSGQKSILSTIGKEDRDNFAASLHLLLKVCDVQVFQLGSCATYVNSEIASEEMAPSRTEFYQWVLSWDGVSDFILACARRSPVDSNLLRSIPNQTSPSALQALEKDVVYNGKGNSFPLLSKIEQGNVDRLSHEFVVSQWSRFTAKNNINKDGIRSSRLALAEINFLEFAKEEVTELVKAIAQQGATELLQFSLEQERKLKEQTEKVEASVRRGKLVKERVIREMALQDSLDHKKEVIRNISDQLRSPLHVIQSTLLDIMSGPDHVSENMKASLDRIRTSCALTANVLDDLLLIGQLEEESVPLHARPLSLPTIVQNCATQLATYASDAGVKLRVSEFNCLCSAHSPPESAILSNYYILADEPILQQIVRNTLLSSLRSTPTSASVDVIVAFNPSGCTPSCSNYQQPMLPCSTTSSTSTLIGVRNRVPTQTMRLIIQDSGSGMTASDIDMMMRIEDSTQPVNGHFKGQGFSLGMKVVRSLVALYGGHMGVVSEVGTGTSMYFDFALHRKPNAIISSPSKTPKDILGNFLEPLRKIPILQPLRKLLTSNTVLLI